MKKKQAHLQETLAIQNEEDLIFGHAPKPVRCGFDVDIGSGEVYPEINFTLPQMIISQETWGDIQKQYAEIINEVCQRAVELEVPALVVEFELLPPMTVRPSWGTEITRIIKEALTEFYHKKGLRSALRVTPVDLRDSIRPPLMRSGEHWERVQETFETCAQAGADLLSIESTGGKEIHDEALLNGDLTGIIFSLGILGVRDMEFLWRKIINLSEKYGKIAAGDTACGFANTAMVLAEKKMIPRILAAMDRTISIVRTLQAHLEGARGPSKDCGYEGPYLKTIAGIPISMEGRSSACAHLSSVGNVAGACCDLWSNESVQNIRLLSAPAPVVSLEQLAFDCRLFNTALREGHESAQVLKRLLVDSDAYLDPQAYVLHPSVVLEISEKIIQYSDPLQRALCAATTTLEIVEEAYKHNEVHLNKGDLRWLDLMKGQLEKIPETESSFLETIMNGPYASRFIPGQYGFS
jgi:methanol--5-hydroxybenzimidazolylcobamide Co-methyltransferase